MSVLEPSLTMPNNSRTYPLYQTQTHEFLALAGCEKGDDSNATFTCLRTLSADTIKNASVAIFAKYQYVTLSNVYAGRPAAYIHYVVPRGHGHSGLYRMRSTVSQIMTSGLLFLNESLVAREPHLSWESGSFNKVPILTGFNS